jgi:hypothetical protein
MQQNKAKDRAILRAGELQRVTLPHAIVGIRPSEVSVSAGNSTDSGKGVTFWQSLLLIATRMTSQTPMPSQCSLPCHSGVPSLETSLFQRYVRW